MLRRFVTTLVLLLFVIAGCQKVPLLAPTGSVISVSAQSMTLPIGGSTQVTATVVESAGTPVHDGTLVRFSASLGRVEPAEVETRGGVATTSFIAGNASGTAEVRATSGAATAGGGGTGGDGAAATASNVVRITVGGAAATVVTVSAAPSRVGPNGGTVTVVAAALDAVGNRLTGVPISFSTDVGSLSQSSAISDGNGEARVSLTTDRQAVVTARVGDKSATVTVAVAAAATLTLATTPASPVSGSPVTLTVTAAANTSPRVVVDWGDGSTEDLGIVSGARSATHVYRQAGSYTITATSNADGATFTTATSVVVGSAAAGLTLTGPDSGTVDTPVVFTVTPGAGTTPRVVIDWGDGSSNTDLGAVTAPRSATHTYSQAGTYIVTANATASGDTFATSRAITINARAALGVSVTADDATPDRCQFVTFTANVTPANTQVTSYQWTVDGSSETTSSRTITRRFETAGTKSISVTANASDGRTGSGSTTVNVSSNPPGTGCT